MGYIKRTVFYCITRWLVQRRWGRRLLFFWALRAIRLRARQFLQDIAELFPVMRPAAAWI
jgi:hypothetical protein